MKEDNGTNSFLMLWSYFLQQDNAKNRLTHGMYLSLARDALVHRKRIRLTHDSGSSLVTLVQVDD